MSALRNPAEPSTAAAATVHFEQHVVGSVERVETESNSDELDPAIPSAESPASLTVLDTATANLGPADGVATVVTTA